jgi:hypothetical protein
VRRSHDVAVQRAADIFSNDSDRGIGGLQGQLGKIIALSRSIVPNFTWRARLSHGFL